MTAAWGSFAGTAYGIQTASRPLGGAWAAPTDLSTAGGDTFDTPAARRGPATATSPRSGNARTRAGSSPAATRAAGGFWGTRRSTLSTPGQDAWDPQVAVDLSGNATALWSRAEEAGRVVQASRRPAGGRLAEPVDLSVGGDAWTPAARVRPGRQRHRGLVAQRRDPLDRPGPRPRRRRPRRHRDHRRDLARLRPGARLLGEGPRRVVPGRLGPLDLPRRHHRDRHLGVVRRHGGGSGPVRVVLTDSVGNATACTYTGTYTCRSTTRIAPVIARAASSTAQIRAVGSDAAWRRRPRPRSP